MQSGIEQFRDWMRRKGFKQADAANFFKWHASVICQYLSGERRPNLPNALKIEEATGIPVKAWLSDDDESEVAVAVNGGKRKIHKA